MTRVAGEHAIVAARSMHPGIVNLVFADGHLEIIAEGIDLHVWRSIGSRNEVRQIQSFVGSAD